jgi:serine/threonine protein kinase
MKDNNFIHRDLNLQNILLAKDGTIKIADFGLPKIFKNYGYSTNSFCGTATTVAPEIIEGKGCTFSADIWSLGCIFYELYLGKSPF